MTIPFDARIDSHGVCLAWKGSAGVVRAHLKRPESLSGTSKYLGTGEGPDVVPAVVRTGAGFAVAYVDSRGVSLAHDSQADTSEATLIFDGGTNVAACRLGSDIVVATSDGQGVRACIDGRFIQLSERTDAYALQVAACGANLLALFLVAGGLSVVRYDPKSERIKEVTHPLREDARELDLAATSDRVAASVGYDNDQVDLGVFNIDGAARERVHPAIRGGGKLIRPRVSWVKTGFVVSAWEPSTKRARIVRDGREKQPVQDVESPFELVSFGDKLYCAEVSEDASAGALLRLHERGPELSTWRTPVPIEPPVRLVRAQERRGREFMRVLAAKQVAGGYRGGAAGAVDVDAMSGELYGQSKPITYSVKVEGAEDLRIEVCIGELGDEESTSLWRLASWVRRRWSPSLRARASADLKWAGEVTGAHVISVDRNPSMLQIQFRLSAYPHPHVFMEWLRELSRDPAGQAD